MFDRLTERARRALAAAREEAARLNHGYIGTEHLLLGIAKEEEGIAAEILSEEGLEVEKIRERIEELVSPNEPGSMETPPEQIPFTPRAAKAMHLAMNEANEMQHSHIGVEHLLLGLLAESEGVGAQVLTRMGADLDKLRERVRKASSAAREERAKVVATDMIGQDLTAAARAAELESVFNLEAKIAAVTKVLLKRHRNCPLLVGEPGTGRRTIVRGLAQEIADSKSPEILWSKKLIAVNLADLAAETDLSDQAEEAVLGLLESNQKSRDIILVTEHPQVLLGARRFVSSRAGRAIASLRRAVLRGELQAIAIISASRYRGKTERRVAEAEVFRAIPVEPATEEETIQIIRGLQEGLALHHGVQIPDAVIQNVVQVAASRLPSQSLPGKAIDLMDEACALVRVRALSPPDELARLRCELRRINAEKDEAVRQEDFNAAAKLRDEAAKLKEQTDALEAEWREKVTGGGQIAVEEEAVLEAATDLEAGI